MVGQQGMKKKDEIAEMLNKILEQATRTREGFTPEVVQSFEQEGRRMKQMREATPSKQLGGVVASKREESRKNEISPHMKQKGIEAAVDLGERLELAASGRKLSMKDWTTG
jgi:hypothetical protein